jgi:redox-sensitive bicupin YhaK (pirin superfamily)
LQSRHTFSFSSYYDVEHTRFRSLRVINEDWIKGGEGFGTHPHDNMEIITYIISGALEHEDSMGNGSVIRPGEVQRMTAGTGITHSEFNPSDDTTHLLQIWIYPERFGLEPGYEQRDFSSRLKPDSWTLLASPCGREDSITVHQDVELHRAQLESGGELGFKLQRERFAWVQVVAGELTVNGTVLEAVDGSAVEEETSLQFRSSSGSEFLLFDLA